MWWQGRSGFRRGSHPGLRCACLIAAKGQAPEAGFAGVLTPAFVVRMENPLARQQYQTVSPGFSPRPSLCDVLQIRAIELERFAGVLTPAFVVRCRAFAR